MAQVIIENKFTVIDINARHIPIGLTNSIFFKATYRDTNKRLREHLYSVNLIDEVDSKICTNDELDFLKQIQDISSQYDAGYFRIVEP